MQKQTNLKAAKNIYPQLIPYKRFVQTYKDYLNTLQMFIVRAKFDCAISKGLFQNIFPALEITTYLNPRIEQVLDSIETSPFEKQYARCGFCSSALAKIKLNQGKLDIQKLQSKCENKLFDQCQNCNMKFPSCAVCLRAVSVLNPMKEFKNSQKLHH